MPTASFSRFRLIVLAAAICGLFSLPAMASSRARIVRLSDVQGSVQIDKNTGLGFERAFINLPITQGTKLSTGDDGRAEVEFEDGSSMRLGPRTSINFSTLNLADSGARISEVNVSQGTAYVNWLAKGGDEFTLNFSREKLTLDHPAHLRLEDSSQVAELAVFKGDIEVQGPSGEMKLEKKKTAVFDVADNDKYTVENKVAELPLDSWDKEASAYHDEYAKNNHDPSPYGYGLSDLNYYGAFSMVPGYGMMWQPYFTGVGWDPFMDGMWSFYPGYGYMFASAYPWGWLPYQYGNWMFVPAYGWMWQPGGWNSWLGVPRYTPTTLVHVNPLVAPTGTIRPVAVGRGAIITPVNASRMVVSRGTAGLGIARGSLPNLNHLNREVAKKGFTRIQPQPQFSNTAPARQAAWERSAGFGAGRAEGTPGARGSSMGRSSAAGRTSMGSSAPMSHGGGSMGHAPAGGTPHR